MDCGVQLAMANGQSRKLRRLEQIRRKQIAAPGVMETLHAGAGEAADAAVAQLAYDRADAWAHSAPGTPYGSTSVTRGLEKP
jgi:hypothetical protein